MPTEAELKKLKVAELKEQLSAAGLPVSGKKDDLIKRLIEHHEQQELEVDLDAEVDDTAVDAELDSMLAAESMDATDAAPAEAAPAEAAPAATTEPAAPLKRSRGSPQPPAEKPAAPSETAVPTVTPSNVATLTAEERRLARMKRFGAVAPDVAKLARAKRFGLAETPADGGVKKASQKKAGKPKTVISAEDLEKQRKRAERFGATVSKTLMSAEEAEKVKKRKERFVQATAEEDAKKKARLEKFGNPGTA